MTQEVSLFPFFEWLVRIERKIEESSHSKKKGKKKVKCESSDDEIVTFGFVKKPKL
jgi:hypothetical protein